MQFENNRMKKLKCLFLGHVLSPAYRYLDKTGNYFYKYKCLRCGALLGFPNMTNEYVKKKYPSFSSPIRVTNNENISLLKNEPDEGFKRKLEEFNIENPLPKFNVIDSVCQCERSHNNNWRYDYEYEQNKCINCGLPWQVDFE